MAKDDTRLGKGLGALLGEYLDEEEASQAERRVPVSRISPNPYQPRTGVEAGALGELVESIRENGLLQPLVVRPTGDGWELVAGERRWRALKKLGWSSAPVIVRELGDREMLVLALVENLQRENLSPIEEARGYAELVESFDLTQKDVADRVGKDRSTISNTLRLLTLDDRVQEMVASGDLTAGHGRALLGLEDGDEQLELARKIVENDLSVRATERKVRRRTRSDDAGESDRAEEPGRDAAGALARRAEQLLERALGTEVTVRLDAGERGRIGITFHDSDEFRRLLEQLAGEAGRELLTG